MLVSTGVSISPLGTQGTTAGVGGVIRDEAAVAAAGRRTVRTSATTTHRIRTGGLARGPRRGPSRRESVGTRSGIDAKRSRYAGQAGMRRRQNVFAWMSGSSGEALHEEERAEPAREQACDRAAPDAQHGQQPGERRPLCQAGAPEELAEVVHLLAPVLEVELDVAVDVECDDGSRSGRDPDLLHREQRELPERALLPEGQDEDGRDDRGAERDPLTPAPWRADRRAPLRIPEAGSAA